MTTRLSSPKCYVIGWIAALTIERAAANAMLDDRHQPPKGFKQHPTDSNSYTWGRIGEHDIVIASLPAGVYGTTSAATTASNMLSSLPHIRVGLMVGIGGGIPYPPGPGPDIRLGDVVVSQPKGTSTGIFQYDLGKALLEKKWEHKGMLNRPPTLLLSAASKLQAQHMISPSKIPAILVEMAQKFPGMSKPMDKTTPSYEYQGQENDRLFPPTYSHAGGKTCAECDATCEIQRSQRPTTNPRVHYGIIASGNTLVKDAVARDELVRLSRHEVLCVEMEAAGLMNHFPCLVIRGICDYADSHKNDRWQRYASAVAAAYAKELLGVLPPGPLKSLPMAMEIMHPAGFSHVEEKSDSSGEGGVAAWRKWLGSWR